MKMLSQIRLIFTDMDETLLTSGKEVTRRARTAIAALRERDVEMVLCTGRAWEATRATADLLGLTNLVCCNGAQVLAGGRMLAEATIPPEVTAELAHYLDSHDINYYLMTPAGFFVNALTPAALEAGRVRGYTPPVLTPGQEHTPAHKVFAPEAARLYPEMESFFGGHTHIIYHPNYLEVAPLGIDKAWGAMRLAEHLGVAQQEVLAFGDALNDVELLTWAGLGVAVANAMPATREAADFTTRGNDEDGVAEVLERVLRAKKADDRRRGGAA